MTNTDIDTVKFSSSEYYLASKTWYEENYESICCSRYRFMYLSIALGILLAISITAIIMMMPLKQYYYRLLEVNKLSGEITVLKEIDNNPYSGSWIVSRYFITQYIQNRNAYSLEDIKRNFNLVIAMTDRAIADSYVASTIDSNPESPIKKLGNSYYREVSVASINQLNANTALVRFKTVTRSKTNLTDVKTDEFQAIVKWEYRNPATSLIERDKNPLGFIVNYYQVSPVFPSIS